MCQHLAHRRKTVPGPAPAPSPGGLAPNLLWRRCRQVAREEMLAHPRPTRLRTDLPRGSKGEEQLIGLQPNAPSPRLPRARGAAGPSSVHLPRGVLCRLPAEMADDGNNDAPQRPCHRADEAEPHGVQVEAPALHVPPIVVEPHAQPPLPGELAHSQRGVLDSPGVYRGVAPLPGCSLLRAAAGAAPALVRRSRAVLAAPPQGRLASRAICGGGCGRGDCQGSRGPAAAVEAPPRAARGDVEVGEASARLICSAARRRLLQRTVRHPAGRVRVLGSCLRHGGCRRRLVARASAHLGP
mmetsp:Transcript_80878/g.219035  ORF Transcript_80878/g.219035 Transcript_80878/m.219035 type:complete len:297 (+) Transcript_80878:119-1009(+)